MEKDFGRWNSQKHEIHGVNVRPMFKEREVWWCSLGANIGDEQDGKGANFVRPILIMKKFNHNIFVGVPFSTKLKDNKFYHKISFKQKEQSALLSQMRVMDAKRFRDKMGEITSNEMDKLRNAIRDLVL